MRCGKPHQKIQYEVLEPLRAERQGYDSSGCRSLLRGEFARSVKCRTTARGGDRDVESRPNLLRRPGRAVRIGAQR